MQHALYAKAKMRIQACGATCKLANGAAPWRNERTINKCLKFWYYLRYGVPHAWFRTFACNDTFSDNLCPVPEPEKYACKIRPYHISQRIIQFPLYAPCLSHHSVRPVPVFSNRTLRRIAAHLAIYAYTIHWIFNEYWIKSEYPAFGYVYTLLPIAQNPQEAPSIEW